MTENFNLQEIYEGTKVDQHLYNHESLIIHTVSPELLKDLDSFREINSTKNSLIIRTWALLGTVPPDNRNGATATTRLNIGSNGRVGGQTELGLENIVGIYDNISRLPSLLQKSINDLSVSEIDFLVSKGLLNIIAGNISTNWAYDHFKKISQAWAIEVDREQLHPNSFAILALESDISLAPGDIADSFNQLDNRTSRRVVRALSGIFTPLLARLNLADRDSRKVDSHQLNHQKVTAIRDRANCLDEEYIGTQAAERLRTKDADKTMQIIDSMCTGCPFLSECGIAYERAISIGEKQLRSMSILSLIKELSDDKGRQLVYP